MNIQQESEELQVFIDDKQKQPKGAKINNMKRYFENEDAELCYPESYFQDEMRNNGLTEMMVLEAIPMKSSETDYMWCKENEATGKKGECGRICDDYEPRNGINGICKHQGRLFEHGNEFILTSRKK